MAKYKKFEVEIGTNGHIVLNGKKIALLGYWNRFEELSELFTEVNKTPNEPIN